jgi:uncharacterized protein (TIGR02271 family)
LDFWEKSIAANRLGSLRLRSPSRPRNRPSQQSSSRTIAAYNELESVDYDREEQVRGVYRNQGTGVGSTATPASYDRSSYSYDIDRPLYETNEQQHQNLKLYEERLIANKHRAKTGEVTVGKRVETETARASVPIDKERVVIERVTPVEAGQVVSAGEADFQSGEVARMEVYEETADIHKEAFVREEVRSQKKWFTPQLRAKKPCVVKN